MKKFTVTASVVLAIVMFVSVAEASCDVKSGQTWTNELGSSMTLNIDYSGDVSGYYTTAVSCTGGSLPATKLQGFCGGDKIYFTVTWDSSTQCPSTTVWQGALKNGKLVMPWTLFPTAPPNTEGSDTFTAK